MEVFLSCKSCGLSQVLEPFLWSWAFPVNCSLLATLVWSTAVPIALLEAVHTGLGVVPRFLQLFHQGPAGLRVREERKGPRI